MADGDAQFTPVDYDPFDLNATARRIGSTALNAIAPDTMSMLRGEPNPNAKYVTPTPIPGADGKIYSSADPRDPVGELAYQAATNLISPELGAGLGAAKLATAGLPMVARKIGAPVAEDAAKGIRAYHGSPYDFDRFDLSKIGTGEGAQAYGHGLYFAENEGTAVSYRDKLGHMANMTVGGEKVSPPKTGAARQAYWSLVHRDMDIDRAIKDAAGATNPEEVQSILEDWKARGFKSEPGRMYEVNINAHPDEFLEWGSKLGDLPENIRSKLGPVNMEETVGAMIGRASHHPMFAGDIVGKSHATPQEVMESLRDRGIPGLKYLDQGSRASGKGSRNYVVFDDKLIDILRKYGILPPLAGGAIAGSAMSLEPVEHDPFVQ